MKAKADPFLGVIIAGLVVLVGLFLIFLVVQGGKIQRSRDKIYIREDGQKYKYVSDHGNEWEVDSYEQAESLRQAVKFPAKWVEVGPNPRVVITTNHVYEVVTITNHARCAHSVGGIFMPNVLMQTNYMYTHKTNLTDPGLVPSSR